MTPTDTRMPEVDIRDSGFARSGFARFIVSGGGRALRADAAGMLPRDGGQIAPSASSELTVPRGDTHDR